MSDFHSLTPEARRRISRIKGGESESRWFQRLRLGDQAFQVVKRVVVGVYEGGFVQAGNFAYMALLAVFAFFILAASIGAAFGTTEFGLQFIQRFLWTVPPDVANALRGPIESALFAKSGPALWLSLIVGLWTVGSLIETIREIQHSAYGTKTSRPFWQYRLTTVAVIILSVIVVLIAFSAQFLITALEQLIATYIPSFDWQATMVLVSKLVPFIFLFGALYVLLVNTSPRRYRGQFAMKWPGAAFVSFWWLAATTLLPVFLSFAGNYDLTYGSLAGAVIALIFFYVIGLGMVIGAHLNAALVNEGADLEQED